MRLQIKYLQNKTCVSYWFCLNDHCRIRSRLFGSCAIRFQNHRRAQRIVRHQNCKYSLRIRQHRFRRALVLLPRQSLQSTPLLFIWHAGCWFSQFLREFGAKDHFCYDLFICFNRPSCERDGVDVRLPYILYMLINLSRRHHFENCAKNIVLRAMRMRLNNWKINRKHIIYWTYSCTSDLLNLIKNQ